MRVGLRRLYCSKMGSGYTGYVQGWDTENVYMSARLSHQSSEFAPPAPSPASECCPPWFQGGDTLAWGRGGGGVNSGEGTDTPVL
jgi:hypothetical protein